MEQFFNNLATNRYFQMGVIGLIAVLLALLVITIFSEDEPEPDVWCSFKGINGQQPVFMGRVQGPVERVSMKGQLSKPRVGSTYDIAGTATFQYRRQFREAEVEGEVTLDETERVVALEFLMTGEQLGNAGLTMATLDENGRAAPDTSEAFLYRDARLRLTHPMFYACSVDLTNVRGESEE